MLEPQNDFFNYSRGRWIVNNDLRLAERRREFDVEELRRLAALSVGRNSQDIKVFAKHAEGGFNRIFLIRMHDGFEMIARIPYPVTVPKYYAIASEVATMRFLRSLGLPIPEVYDYCPSPDNAAQTEYIFMEYIEGTDLSDIFEDLEEPDIESIMRQVTELEALLMSIPFPAGGSIYYTSDLKKMTGSTGVPLDEDAEFCVGPDVRLHMWYGRRSQLDIDRGPYLDAEATLVAPARKELTYLRQFGRPLQPFQRLKRETYEYKEQQPSDHIENLERYLLIAPALAPMNRHLHPFCIRHPDLQPSNIKVSMSESAGSKNLKIEALLDWQHATILPLFLIANIPGRFQNYEDPVSQDLIPPSLPDNMSELNENEQREARNIHLRRLIHYHYMKNTEKYNSPHYAVLSDSVCMFVCRLFDYSGPPWEGETHDLKMTLIEATELWGVIAGPDTPCPITFDPEDVRKTKELGEKLENPERTLKKSQASIGFGQETWVPFDSYARSKARAEFLKERYFALAAAEDLPMAKANWFLDDMDETDYL